MLEIRYLLIQENHPEAYEIHCTGITSNLSDTCKVNDLIQQASADIRLLLSLDSQPITISVYKARPSYQLHKFISPVHVHSYSCLDPYPPV